MDKVVHFEIPYDEAGRAKKFYQDSFDWKTSDMPEMNYTLVTTVPTGEDRMPKESGAINGGMMKRDENSPYPIIVINVDSLEESLKKVREAGGEVTMDIQKVGDMGLYAHIKDTEGNIIGVWESLKDM